MSYDIVRKYIAEDAAKLVSYEDNELLFRRQLVRNWPAEPDKYIEDALTYLYTYAYDQGTTEPPVARQSIPSPKAERLEYSGTWRVVKTEKVSRDNEAQWPGLTGIVQTLRYGFAQALTWDECRVINNEQLPGNISAVTGISETTSDDPNDVIVLEWVNLDPLYVRAIMASTTATIPLGNDSIAINSATVVAGVPSAPRGTTQTTYNGTYHKIAVTHGESELGDGSAILRVVLAKPQYTLNAYESYFTYGTATQEGVVHYLWNVPRDLAQTIITDWKAARRTATASLNSDKTVNLVLREFDPGVDPITITSLRTADACSSIEDTTYYWGVTDPENAAYDIVNLNATGVTYRKNVSFSRSEGTWDVVIVKVTAVARAPYTAKTVEKAALEQRTETLKLSQTSLPTITDPETGEVTTLDLRINDDCTNDSVERVIISTEYVEIVSWDGPDGAVYQGTYRNWDGPTLSGQGILTNFLDTTAINEALYRISMSLSPNKDGTFDATVNAVPDASSGGAGGAAATYAGFTYWNTQILNTTVTEVDDSVVSYYVPEYTQYAVEYYAMGTYTEATVFQQINGRGFEGVVTTVGAYFRLHMVIGRQLEVSPGLTPKRTSGIGDTDPAVDTAMVPNSYAYREEPPIPE